MLERCKAEGMSHVVLDGMLIDTDRLAGTVLSVRGRPIDQWYSGKHARFGGNVQFLAAPDGAPLWVGDVEPGSTHDITAAQTHALPALYAAAAAGMPTLADAGYEGTGIGVHVPVKRPAGKPTEALHADTRTYNSLLRGTRALGERTAAELKQRWRTLKHVTLSPSHIGDITRAALVLNQQRK